MCIILFRFIVEEEWSNSLKRQMAYSEFQDPTKHFGNIGVTLLFICTVILLNSLVINVFNMQSCN